MKLSALLEADKQALLKLQQELVDELSNEYDVKLSADGVIIHKKGEEPFTYNPDANPKGLDGLRNLLAWQPVIKDLLPAGITQQIAMNSMPQPRGNAKQELCINLMRNGKLMFGLWPRALPTNQLFPLYAAGDITSAANGDVMIGTVDGLDESLSAFIRLFDLRRKLVNLHGFDSSRIMRDWTRKSSKNALVLYLGNGRKVSVVQNVASKEMTVYTTENFIEASKAIGTTKKDDDAVIKLVEKGMAALKASDHK